MWRHCIPREEPLSSAARCSLPQPPSSLAPGGPQLHGNQMLTLDEELVCTLGHDLSQIPSAVRSTVRHLTSRHREVSQWQAQICETIGQVDREVAALEHVRSTAESFLQEKLLYGQLMAECLQVKDSLDSGPRAPDAVLTALQEEAALTREITERLQKQTCISSDKASSLKEIRAQLLADYQDKGEAIKLTTKCITGDINDPMSQPPASELRPSYIRYDKWESRCKDIKLAADDLVKDSSSFRGNLRFTLARMKNALERQSCHTNSAMQRKINELSKIQERLRWEKQQIMDKIKDLTNDTHKVAGQIRNCASKLHQTSRCLDILNQRPRRELCLDPPSISLILEKKDLTKMASGLQPTLQRCQRDMEPMHRRLSVLEDSLAATALALKVEQRCHNLHQSFLPLHNNSAVIHNQARLCRAAGPSGPSGPAGPYSLLE